MTKKTGQLVRIVVLAAFITALVSAYGGLQCKAFAQGSAIIYPAKGQSQKTQEKDKYECYTWAKGQTGFDPMQVGSTSNAPPPPQGPGGERVKGAARGAAVGAVAGGIAGDAGKGAAAGAAGGAMIGGMKNGTKQASKPRPSSSRMLQLLQSRANTTGLLALAWKDVVTRLSSEKKVIYYFSKRKEL